MSLRPGKYELRIGPSEVEHHAIDWYLVDTDPDTMGPAGTGGWACPASAHPETPDGWVRRARQHGLIPRRVRTRDLEVAPLGWSQGAGHAPQGARIRFRLREPRA